MDTRTAVDWHLKGTVLIACNCDYGCPCNFNARPTTDDCEGAWTWHIDEGQFGQTRLDGLNVSVAADWPGAIHEGSGEALVLIDERADEAQREALLTLLGGKVGGPWAIVGATLTEVHGPRYVPYHIVLDGERTDPQAGEALELEMEPIRNPVTGAEAHPRAVLPEGFIIKKGRSPRRRRSACEMGLATSTRASTPPLLRSSTRALDWMDMPMANAACPSTPGGVGSALSPPLATLVAA